MLPFLCHLCIFSSFHSFPSVIYQISKHRFLQISTLKGTISVEKQFSRFQISFPWKVVPWTLSIGNDKDVATVTSRVILKVHCQLKHYPQLSENLSSLQEVTVYKTMTRESTTHSAERLQDTGKIHFRKDSASSLAFNLWILSYCGIPALDFSSRHVPSFLVFQISCFRAPKQNKTAFKTVVFHYDL